MTPRPASTFRAGRRNLSVGRGPLPEGVFSPYGFARNQRRFLARGPRGDIAPQGKAVPPRSKGPRSSWPGARKPHTPPNLLYTRYALAV